MPKNFKSIHWIRQISVEPSRSVARNGFAHIGRASLRLVELPTRVWRRVSSSHLFSGRTAP